jgi:RNA ligase (TIGR02306 family)
MSNFQVLVQPIFIKNHPNADRLELGNIGSKDGWQVVVGKGLYKTGDLVVYIGENSLCPEWVLKKYGYWNVEKDKGLLAGTKGDRVKGCKLRDAFSLGICIPVKEVSLGYSDEDNMVNIAYELEDEYVQEGEDVAELLGIIKYEAPIPVHMSGEVFNAGDHIGVNYDIEDLKNYPDVFIEGEEVQATCKIHGSLVQVVITSNPDIVTDDWFKVGDNWITLSSKGLGAKGLFFKNNEANKDNLYIRATKQYFEFLSVYVSQFRVEIMTIIGEVFGSGVQDLTYGLANNQIGFRLFDIYHGYRSRGYYFSDYTVDDFCSDAPIDRVPLVYRGPYSKELMIKLANDPEDSFPNCKHIREGIVIKPVQERRDPKLGRVVLKTRSEKYMSRKGGSEYN